MAQIKTTQQANARIHPHPLRNVMVGRGDGEALDEEMEDMSEMGYSEGYFNGIGVDQDGENGGNMRRNSVNQSSLAPFRKRRESSEADSAIGNSETGTDQHIVRFPQYLGEPDFFTGEGYYHNSLGWGREHLLNHAGNMVMNGLGAIGGEDEGDGRGIAGFPEGAVVSREKDERVVRFKEEGSSESGNGEKDREAFPSSPNSRPPTPLELLDKPIPAFLRPRVSSKVNIWPGPFFGGGFPNGDASFSPPENPNISPMSHRLRTDSSATISGVLLSQYSPTNRVSICWQYMCSMISQNLKIHKVPNTDMWEKHLTRLLAKVSKHIHVNVRGGDRWDPRAFVKIKKIPGGKISDCEYVSGYVCSKNLMDKNMDRVIRDPRIMIFDYSVARDDSINTGVMEDYQKVLRQEDEHILNEVNRILIHKPQVVLFGTAVPRLALEQFKKEKISVAHNVKPEGESSLILRYSN
jgi:hypothetical protein